MSGYHDQRTQRGKVGARPGGGRHGRMNKTIPWGGGVPLWGYFSMWAVFSLHVEARQALRLYLPFACTDRDLHSLYSVCLRELEKK